MSIVTSKEIAAFHLLWTIQDLGNVPRLPVSGREVELFEVGLVNLCYPEWDLKNLSDSINVHFYTERIEFIRVDVFGVPWRQVLATTSEDFVEDACVALVSKRTFRKLTTHLEKRVDAWNYDWDRSLFLEADARGWLLK